jgi:hypothetical protein
VPLFFVSAPGWNQDTLTGACKADPNMVGGLIIDFTTFFTEANWVVFNAETEHVTPSLIYVSCWNEIPVVVTPTINLHTQKSPAQWTVPLAPVSGIITFFAPVQKVVTTSTSTTSSSGTTTSTQVQGPATYGIGTTALLAAAGAFQGINVGVYNPGHEALHLAQGTSIYVAAITQALCHLNVASSNPLYDELTEAQAFLNPTSAMPEQMYPSFSEILGLDKDERYAFSSSDLSKDGWATPTPAPIGYDVSVSDFGKQEWSGKVRNAFPSSASPKAVPGGQVQPPARPLGHMCYYLGPQSPVQ